MISQESTTKDVKLFGSSNLSKILVNCLQQVTALDLPLYDIFAQQNVPLLKIPDDVIACSLPFSPIKNLGYAYGYVLTTDCSHI